MAAHEILLKTQAMPGIIREGNIAMLNSLIASNRKLGMQALDDALLELVKRKLVQGAVAHAKARDKKRFAQTVFGAGQSVLLAVGRTDVATTSRP